ncbi:hypothetical protein Tco_0060159 [Tanacetum coccineum]
MIRRRGTENHPPPPRVWGDRTQDEWNELVHWWSHPNEYKVEKGHYEDLIETWRKGHSSKKTGEFKTEQNKQRYLDMKAMQEMIKAGIIPFKTDQEILDEVVPSDNRQNMSGMGRKLPGGGSTSRRRANRAYEDVMTRDQMTQILRQQEQEKELYRKQAEEAQARAYLASLKADAADQRANVAYQNTESIYGALDLARENNNECSSREEEEEEGEQLSGDDYWEEDRTLLSLGILASLHISKVYTISSLNLTNLASSFFNKWKDGLYVTNIFHSNYSKIEEGKKMVVEDNGSIFEEIELDYYNSVVESGSVKRGGRRKKSVGRIDGGCKITGCSGRVKDYMMECIAREIKQRPKSEWITADASSSAVHESEKKKSKSGWIGGCRSMRKRIKKMMRCMSIIERRGVGARAGVVEVVLIDGWMDLVYSCGGDLLEKCDDRNFGVLLLVVIAGRRPLQVGGSPMSEFQRAILSWARHLARAWKLIDLVDHSIQDMDKEQALVCITMALLCLQKTLHFSLQ